MKKFLVALVLIINLQSWTISDDAIDFEIEGLSIGNSMLDYFSQSEINRSKKSEYKYGEEFATLSFIKKSFEVYDKVQIHYKLSDDYYKIYGLVGVLYFEENFNDCLKKKDEIVSSISVSYKNLKKENYDRRKHAADKSGNSYTHDTIFFFSDGNYLNVSCYDWSKEKNIENKWFDNLKVSIIDKEFDDFLIEYYK